MQTLITRITRGFALLALSTLAAAQEIPELQPPSADPQAEMKELFKKVELRLQRMSELLGEASAGDVDALRKLGGAGIDELIRAAETRPPSGASPSIASLIEATRGHGREVVKEIDQVLEIARQQQQQQQQQGGGGGQQQQPPQPGGQQPQQGQTPENSRQMQGEQAPRPGGEQEQQQQDGNDPRGNQDNPATTPMRPGDQPPGAEIGAPSGEEGGGQWGDLPVHVRRVFQNGVSEDVPPRYRDWIDAYHKRLSTRAPR